MCMKILLVSVFAAIAAIVALRRVVRWRAAPRATPNTIRCQNVKCGRDNPPGARYCATCGTKLID